MESLSELATRGPFSVIYADPAWPSGSKSAKRPRTWISRNMLPPYLCMTARQLLELPVVELAAPNCLLALWSTWMHLGLAHEVIKAWGFKYCAGMPWLKVTKSEPVRPIFGPGIWFRGCSELLLIAKRGRFPNPRPARPGIVMCPRGEHSAKPLEVRDWIEQKLPGPRVELFARQRHVGWEAWGDECPNDSFENRPTA